MGSVRQEMCSPQPVRICAICVLPCVPLFVLDNGTGAPPVWNWMLSLWVDHSLEAYLCELIHLEASTHLSP